ncbi:MAG: aldo/keto reductase [Anaerolineales bacterium]|nr:aldo/keto reductase [Anaerolineales bacterium]
MTNGPRKRILGKTGIEVPEVGVGLWAAGGKSWGPTNDQEIFDLIDRALDLGVDFFDTADVYGDGHSEVLLGESMKGRRDEFVVATKIGWINFDPEKNQSQYTSPEKIVQGVEENLKRLQTDYVDIIQDHIDIPDGNVDNFLEGFERLKAAGKVRAFGISTGNFELLKEFDKHDNTGTLQIDYSILNRTPESEIFPYVLEKNIGVLVRGPLAMGILTGKFNKDSKFGEGDFRARWHENSDEYEIFLDDLRKVELVKPLVKDQTMAQFALQFVLHHQAVSTVIPGAKNIKQLEDNLKPAFVDPLDQDVLKKIEGITPVGGGRKIWPA